MNKKNILIFVGCFIVIAISFIFFMLFFSNKKNDSNNDFVMDDYITVEEEQKFIPRKINHCVGLDCMKNTFKDCIQSQFFENEEDLANSKGVAIFGEFDSKCFVVFSYSLKDNVECYFEKDVLSEDIFNKLWFGNISNIDDSVKKYCKISK